MSEVKEPVVEPKVEPVVEPVVETVDEAAAKDAAKAAEIKAGEAKKEEPAAVKPAEEKVSEGKKPEEKVEEKKKIVPEKYDLKLSDKTSLDASALEQVAALAKQNGLSQEEAQAYLEKTDTTVRELYDQQTKNWLEQVKGDAELGGEGLNKTVETAKRVIERFGSDALKKDLDRTGYGNHPELVRLLSRIGKGMSEDQLVVAGGKPTSEMSIAEAFYGTNNK